MKKQLLKRCAACFLKSMDTLPAPVYEENQYGRGQWVMRTKQAAIHFVLNQYFGIPVGRKKLTSIISRRVISTQNQEVKFAALAGMLSSDGYINSNRKVGRFGVNVGLLTTVSAVLLRDREENLGSLRNMTES